ncbi:Bug family tripartite tricarboxylate transporter substrate binding protein [Paracandidimonas soli]|uniref:Tripartite-type tricarboxylate transporter receptor subunit TctC n=2 Tax=Pseudomonadota TaxID=1224 RepID=A0A4R3V6M1_9BURK|nr:tripartite tricarboxylate transporter substrate binding protein [Paracandidimonas soli]TCU99027.1 tripartite-type tricarboxylate transporter receptor subunit TctC [Paracandidimonas soli]
MKTTWNMKLAGMLGMATLVVAGLATSAAAQANEAAGYPNQLVKIIVPYAPGGFNDTLGRMFARAMQESMGQSVVVENHGGAGTVVGTRLVSRAPADGYTLLVNGFPFILNQFLYKELPYKNTDFTPVIAGAKSNNLLVVRADSPFKSVKDLVDYAKANPGKLNYATAGNGSSNHVTMEYFKSVAGIKMMGIPYKGSAPMVTDLLGGQVDVMFDNVPHVLPHVQAGKMRALAITNAERSSLAPEVPTIAEQGYPGFEVSVPYGLLAPAGTPPAIVEKINGVLQQAMKTPEFTKVFEAQGVEAMSGSAEDFGKFIEAESAKWKPVVEQAGIVLN